MQYDLGKYIKKMKEQSVKGVSENEAKVNDCFFFRISLKVFFMGSDICTTETFCIGIWNLKIFWSQKKGLSKSLISDSEESLATHLQLSPEKLKHFGTGHPNFCLELKIMDMQLIFGLSDVFCMIWLKEERFFKDKQKSLNFLRSSRS